MSPCLLASAIDGPQPTRPSRPCGAALRAYYRCLSRDPSQSPRPAFLFSSVLRLLFLRNPPGTHTHTHTLTDSNLASVYLAHTQQHQQRFTHKRIVYAPTRQIPPAVALFPTAAEEQNKAHHTTPIRRHQTGCAISQDRCCPAYLIGTGSLRTHAEHHQTPGF